MRMRRTTQCIGDKLNRNTGIVEQVIDNGQKIVFRSFRGGKKIYKNKGFERGDILCYTLNQRTGEIVEFIPKKIADTLVFLGEHAEIQRLIEEEPHGNIHREESFDCSARSEDQIMADCRSHENREIHIIGEDYGEHATPHLDPDWDGDFYHVEKEDGDLDNIPLPLPPGSDKY